jgi:hypothetical protein
MAYSEPPAGPGTLSSAPPLFDLTHSDAQQHDPRSPEDVDFLLGLRGSPGTAAALISPSFADLTRKAASEPPPATKESPEIPVELAATPEDSRPPARDPANRGADATPTTATTATTAPKRRFGPLAALAVSGAVLATGTLSRHTPLPAPTPSAHDRVAESAAPAESALRATPAADSSAAPSPEPVRADTAATGPKVSSRGAPGTRKPSPEGAASGPPKPSVESSAAPDKPVTQVVVHRSEPAAPVGAGFDRAAAASALGAQVAQASSCRKPGDPSGTASVTITFAPSGRVTSASVSGPPFAGTATGGCIAATLRRAKIPAYDGDKVTVAKSVVIQ